MGQNVIIRFWWESGLSSASRNHRTTFCIRFVHYAFKIGFCDSSLYRTQLSLFCLLWLISACADRIGYIINFCSMVELLHENKKAVVNIEAFRQCFSRDKVNLKVCCTSIYHKQPTISCVLDAHSQFLCGLARFDLANRGVRQPVQPHTYARLLVFDETLAQPDFAVVNCSDAAF